jgi:hypothetical protein
MKSKDAVQQRQQQTAMQHRAEVTGGSGIDSTKKLLASAGNKTHNTAANTASVEVIATALLATQQ